jgi:hypothetical protein
MGWPLHWTLSHIFLPTLTKALGGASCFYLLEKKERDVPNTQCIHQQANWAEGDLG